MYLVLEGECVDDQLVLTSHMISVSSTEHCVTAMRTLEQMLALMLRVYSPQSIKIDYDGDSQQQVAAGLAMYLTKNDWSRIATKSGWQFSSPKRDEVGCHNC